MSLSGKEKEVCEESNNKESTSESSKNDSPKEDVNAAKVLNNSKPKYSQYPNGSRKLQQQLKRAFAEFRAGNKESLDKKPRISDDEILNSYSGKSGCIETFDSLSFKTVSSVIACSKTINLTVNNKKIELTNEEIMGHLTNMFTIRLLLKEGTESSNGESFVRPQLCFLLEKTIQFLHLCCANIPRNRQIISNMVKAMKLRPNPSPCIKHPSGCDNESECTLKALKKRICFEVLRDLRCVRVGRRSAPVSSKRLDFMEQNEFSAEKIGNEILAVKKLEQVYYS